MSATRRRDSAMELRVGTWNLDRPRKNRTTRDEARQKLLTSLNADIWILTETHQDFVLPGYGSQHSAPPTLATYTRAEAYASIHSRLSMTPIAFDTFDPAFALCAAARTPLGPAVIYASIITYHFDGVAAGSAPWELHQKSCIAHGGDWAKLRKLFPGHSLIAGGDWNQALDGRGQYRNRTSTALLRKSLSGADLTLLTDADFLAGGLSRHSVDHIAATVQSQRWESKKVEAFEGALHGLKLSDHNGVVVTLRKAD